MRHEIEGIYNNSMIKLSIWPYTLCLNLKQYITNTVIGMIKKYIQIEILYGKQNAKILQ